MDAKTVSVRLFIKKETEIIKEWLNTMKLFTPQRMRLSKLTNNRFRKYFEKRFHNEIDNEINEDKFNLSYNDEYNVIIVNKRFDKIDTVTLSALLDIEIYIHNEKKINKLINQVMERAGIAGRMVETTDNIWQNETFITNYKTFKRSLEGIPVKKDPNNPNGTIVDVEKMPGYEAIINNVWYGASWRMWFNTPYYDYVSKKVIENYKDCYKNEKLSNDCFCITLYENIEDYDKPENRELQWKFKRAINFDELVRKAKEIEAENKKPIDPEIDLETGEFENGGKRRKITYLNDAFGITHKSKATQAEIIEYDGNGKFIWQGMKKIEELK